MFSCSKDKVEPTPTYTYNIRMTDIPGPYNAVFIDLQGVELTGNDGHVVLTTVHKGIYNLLDFSGGLDTLIATSTLEFATVQQIRLILGSDNYVVVDSISYPLSTPSAEQSGLKIQVHQVLSADALNSVLLDFDANASIVDEGNGSYTLKPVIRTIETTVSGSIKGRIAPAGLLAFVTATSNTSYSSNVNINGEFLIRGLPSGIYSVTVTPALPLMPITQNNITVSTGITTDTDTFFFY